MTPGTWCARVRHAVSVHDREEGAEPGYPEKDECDEDQGEKAAEFHDEISLGVAEEQSRILKV